MAHVGPGGASRKVGAKKDIAPADFREAP
jgi:hypothetical protein